MIKTPRFAEQWLSFHQTGYADFDDEDRVALREFAVIWTIFESQALLGNSSVEAMLSYVDDFARIAEADERRLLTAPFIPHLSYFRELYVDEATSSTNAQFEGLQIQSESQKELVSSSLIRLREETPELIKALLIITHRLRHQLFLGLKSKRLDRKQRDDLYHASKVLMKAVDASKL